MADKIYIVGIGEDGPAGLTAPAREVIGRAQVLVGSDRVLRFFRDHTAQKIVVGPSPQDVVERLRGLPAQTQAVLLADGDPFFYGVARYVCDRLGKERFEIIPHVSTMQLAFARIKESWEDAYLTSVGHRPIEALIDRLRAAEKVGLFTDETHTPGQVARELLARGIDYFDVWVCENLGAPDERVTHASLADIAGMDFSALNVMILVRLPDRPDKPREGLRFKLFGNPDDVFIQSRPKSDLITRAPIRAIALAQLDVRPTSIVWDIGAGSGSLSIEAAQLAHEGMVYAIESDVDEFHLISANAEKFGVHNIQPILGTAPEALEGLPRPDAVFMEGVTSGMEPILTKVHERLLPAGRLVASMSTLEGLYAVHTALRAMEPDTQLMVVNITRGRGQMDQVAFEAQDPRFLVWAVKTREPAGPPP